jgi:transcriptional regulator
MIEGIVAFEFEITRLEGAYKLSQNRSPRDQKNVADELTRSVNPSAKATGQFMHTLRKEP